MENGILFDQVKILKHALDIRVKFSEKYSLIHPNCLLSKILIGYDNVEGYLYFFDYSPKSL